MAILNSTRMIFAPLVLGLTLVSCSSPTSISDGGGGSTPRTKVAEVPTCVSGSVPSNPVTITSRATFIARELRYVAGNSNQQGLFGALAAQDIKYAEVWIYDGAGNRIQCGETDGSGNISIQIPKTAGNYVLQVNSRADSTHVKVSVLNDFYDNKFYSIKSNFSLNGSESSPVSINLTPAPFNGTLEGGAFNILNLIYNANEYLRNHSTCPSQNSVCALFTVAPKIPVFWTPGLSPATYLGTPTSSISFFNSTPYSDLARGLYILGGVSGNVDCMDTDHFDYSVVLHEYGHFLEDVYARSDSPGGSHNGNKVIDARLAWSEGWANFVQSAFRDGETTEKYYLDTIANSSCTSRSQGIAVVLDLSQTAASASLDAMGPSTTVGEGTFREVSISRALYKIKNSAGTVSGGANVQFALMWDAFSDSTNGIKNTNYHFRNMGLFNNLLFGLVSAHASGSVGAYTGIMTNEYQRTVRDDYGLVLTQVSGSCSSFSIDASGPAESGSDSFSKHQLKSNDFYEYYHDGSSYTITVNYSGSSEPVDVDLFLYKNDYVFGDTTDGSIVKRSDTAHPSGALLATETINMAGVAAGTYMININLDRSSPGSSKAAASYFFSTSTGKRLCP